MRTAIVALVVAACSFGGQRPNYQYFVLSSQTTPGAARTGRSLVITKVTIPEYLDREQLATRTLENHLVYSTTERWAEPLDEGFERTLREDLVARGVAVQPHEGAYELAVDVVRFERAGTDHVELWARWTLSRAGEVASRGETRLRVPVASRDGNTTASALSGAIEQLAARIAS